MMRMTSGRDYGGKGSTRRPINNREQFDKNWDSIFGKCDNEKSNGIDDNSNKVDTSRKDSRTTTR